MIRVIFKNNKASGYATVGYSSDDANEVVCPIEEKEIEEISGKDWQEGYKGLELKNVIKSERSKMGSRHAKQEDVELEFDSSVFEDKEES